MVSQEAIQGTERAIIDAFVQQGRIHLTRRTILKTLTVEHLTHPASFAGTERPGWGGTWQLFRHPFGLPATIERAAGKGKECARLPQGDRLRQCINRLDHARFSLLAVKVCSKTCASFFCAAM